MLNWTSCCLNCVELDLLVLLDHYSPCCGICSDSLTIFLSSTSVNETLNILLTKPVYSGVSTWRGSPSVPEYGKAVSYHHWHGETQDKMQPITSSPPSPAFLCSIHHRARPRVKGSFWPLWSWAPPDLQSCVVNQCVTWGWSLRIADTQTWGLMSSQRAQYRVPPPAKVDTGTMDAQSPGRIPPLPTSVVKSEVRLRFSYVESSCK